MEAARAHPLLGFYGPESMMWRINREAVLLGAGPTALLLQIAHPSVARGVAEHSNFEADPFRRLHGTIHTTMALVFGDGRQAERAVRRLNGIHARIRGDDYRALDPALLLWVQVTLIVTSVRAYELWVRRLEPPEKEQFWQEARRVGVRLGITLAQSPADWAALQAYWANMLAADGPIQVSDTAQRLAPLIVRPPLPLVPRPLVDLLALPGLALVPARLRDAFGIGWSPAHERLASLIGLAIRLWVRLVPAPLRSLPHANAAWRRAGGNRSSSYARWTDTIRGFVTR